MAKFDVAVPTGRDVGDPGEKIGYDEKQRRRGRWAPFELMLEREQQLRNDRLVEQQRVGRVLREDLPM